MAAPALHFVHRPAALDDVHAAALPIAGVTAWQGLVDIGRVGPGHRVLIHAAGGGVGHTAVHVAKARGAHVIATASGGKRALVESLGADEIVDYAEVDFAAVVSDVDVVLDTVGGEVAARSLDVLRPGGHLVTAVADEDTELAARVEASGRRFSGIAVDPDPVALQGLIDLVERGGLRVHVQRTFPFEQIADAHRLLEAGHLTGKVVLTV